MLPFGDIGYNICKEARSILGIKRKPEVGAKISKSNTGRKNTEEVKDKIRQTMLSKNLKMPQYLKDILSIVNKERMTGRVVSPETRQKISLATKGVPNTKLKGIPLKKEHKDKLSKSLKGRDIVNRVKVDQYNLDGVFIKTHESMRAAGIEAGKVSYSRNIYTVCVGKQKTAYGFIWKYHDINKK